jgi:uncharacterized protein YbbC (DUF1343 family)/CubicO group peptidase (beta-lactamase class C family)
MNARIPFPSWLALLVTLLASRCSVCGAAEKPLPAAKPESVGMSSERLDRIDGAVQAALGRGDLPGAVVVIVHRGHVVLRKAYGLRSKQPENTLMGVDTLFDLASLTKPVVTATALMLLVEEGKLRLTDRVAQYLPAFRRGRKDETTIEQLLVHTGGCIADNPLADYRAGRAKALERVFDLAPVTEPGTRFLYSDVGYIILGELVERVSGMPLDQFAAKHIFAPLGMNETGFRPQGQLKLRAAPTEKRDGRWLQGEVHDPRAHLLGGVAGHAGLFATADDLAVFAQMLLNHGAYNGHRLLSPLTVRLMTTPRPVQGKTAPGLRALGWDVDTSYSANRGELFPRGESFGHTGFTGTSLWIDPGSQTAVVFLSNRVHPDGKGNVTRLRGQVATLAAAALLQPGGKPLTPVATGIDVLVREKFARLKGRRVGLVTNHTGRDRDGHATIDLLHGAAGVTLVALFSPEHGIRGAVDAHVPDSKDDKTGLPIYSLYGARRKPGADTLKGIDTLVYDIQDAGCRFYTYISTLGLLLEAAAEHKVNVVVLDRPNPLGGVAVEGPILDAGRESFVGYHALPIRHGLTVGELALLFNQERKIGADLEVVRMEGWKRADLFDRTGLTWVNPSPNLRSWNAALLYPGIGLLETTNVSVGRGTERPFEWIGAPWLNGQKLAMALAEQGVPGVRFVPLNLTPTASVHKGKACGGVQFLVDDWARFQPVRTGLTVACTLHKLYPEAWQVQRFDVLLGHRATWQALQDGASARDLEKRWQADLNRFKERRRAFLLYAE